jgi:hypothetical protein
VTVFGSGATAAISRTLSALSPACVCMQGATAHLPISNRKRLFAEASNSHRASRLYTYLPQALQPPLQRRSCCKSSAEISRFVFREFPETLGPLPSHIYYQKPVERDHRMCPPHRRSNFKSSPIQKGIRTKIWLKMNILAPNIPPFHTPPSLALVSHHESQQHRQPPPPAPPPQHTEQLSFHQSAIHARETLRVGL